MMILIPKRGKIPKTKLYIKVLRKEPCEDTFWSRKVFILLHGGPGGNHSLYADIENDLLEFADLIIPDMRGCGLSSKANVKYCHLKNHIQDLNVLINKLKIDKPIIHGCSYGAIVALGYAIKYPNSILKLILSSGAVSGKFIESAKKNLLAIGTKQQIEVAQKLWNGSFKNSQELSEYYKIMSPLYFYNINIQPPATQNNIPYNVKLINEAFTSFLKTFDYRRSLNKIKVPTLIFSGKNDWIIDPDQADCLHDGIKNSILIKLEKCGHFPWKDQKFEFLKTAGNFIKHYS